MSVNFLENLDEIFAYYNRTIENEILKKRIKYIQKNCKKDLIDAINKSFEISPSYLEGYDQKEDGFFKLAEKVFNIISKNKIGVKKELFVHKYAFAWIDYKNDFEKEDYEIALCHCGEKFIVKDKKVFSYFYIHRAICPKCFNTDYKFLKSSGKTNCIDTLKNIFFEDNKIKFKTVQFHAGLNSKNQKVFFVKKNYQYIIINLKTGKSYYLYKANERSPFSITTINQRIVEQNDCQYDRNKILEMIEVFEKEKKINLNFLKEWMLEKKEISLPFGLCKNKKEKHFVLKENTIISTLVALNKNPELIKILCYSKKISKNFFEGILFNFLKNRPKKLSNLSPEKTLSKILDVDICKYTLRDIVKKKLNCENVKIFVWLRDIVGIDNARYIISKCKKNLYQCYCEKNESDNENGIEVLDIIEKVLKSGDPNYTKKKMINLYNNDSFHYYRDILRMINQIKVVEPNFEYENLDITNMTSKQIKYVHDKIAGMARYIKNEKTEDYFKNKYKELKKYEYAKGKYKIVIPKKPEDLIEEGASLSHCVGGYINSVIEGNCNIIFLRNKKDDSVATIETRKNNIVQVKGYDNIKPQKSVFNFIDEWCKTKKLNFKSW